MLFVHRGKSSAQWYCDQKLVDGAQELLDELEARGAIIIICTARPDTYHEETLNQLKSLRVPFHGLLMGLTSGPRFVVNDAKPDCPETAFGVTVPRNGPIDHKAILKGIYRAEKSSSRQSGSQEAQEADGVD